jgi:hypothetical protein
MVIKNWIFFFWGYVSLKKIPKNLETFETIKTRNKNPALTPFTFAF